jgi:rhodanese-related sulfurtransferase
LAVKSDLTQEDLAGLLFESLRNKIMTLPDDVIVYPAHGAGSACGKNMSKETYDTLGNQKRVNYALRADMSKEAFIKELTSGIMPAPQYFSKNAMLNKGGYDSVDEVMERGLRALKPSEVAQEIEAGALVLDVRKPQEFAAGHLPNAMFIGIDGTFAVWVGTLIKDLNQRIVLVAPEGREEEAVLRLARVGYDNAVGYLAGGVAAWQNAGLALETVTSIPATEFKSRYDAQGLHVLDVRKPGEHISEHVIGAESYPLDFINSHLHDLDKSKTYHVHCAGGYRSMIAISILKAHGYTHLIDVAGGFKAISEAGVAKSAYVCPSTIAS